MRILLIDDEHIRAEAYSIRFEEELEDVKIDWNFYKNRENSI